MKFKVGDKVRVYRNTSGGAGIGKKFIISNCRYEGNKWVYWGEGSDGTWSECNLELVGKSNPVKYVVVYDLRDRDPAKTFTDKKELDKWLEEAKDDENIIFSSIRVFEVSKEMKVKMSFSLKAV